MNTNSTRFVLVAAALTLASGCATQPARLGDKTGFYRDVAFSPDGRLVAATRNVGSESVVFDLATRVERAHFQPDQKAKAGMVFSQAYTPGGELLAAHSSKNEVTVWNAST